MSGGFKLSKTVSQGKDDKRDSSKKPQWLSTQTTRFEGLNIWMVQIFNCMILTRISQVRLGTWTMGLVGEKNVLTPITRFTNAFGTHSIFNLSVKVFSVHLWKTCNMLSIKNRYFGDYRCCVHLGLWKGVYLKAQGFLSFLLANAKKLYISLLTFDWISPFGWRETIFIFMDLLKAHFPTANNFMRQLLLQFLKNFHIKFWKLS